MAKLVCLIPKCGRKVKNRGLCGNCYQSAYMAVLSGKTSWGDLVKRGFALESSRKKSAFTDAFEKQK